MTMPLRSSRGLVWEATSHFGVALPDDLPSLSGEATLSGISNEAYDKYNYDESDDVEDDENGGKHCESVGKFYKL